jgi:hypothetical protein
VGKGGSTDEIEDAYEKDTGKDIDKEALADANKVAGKKGKGKDYGRV